MSGTDCGSWLVTYLNTASPHFLGVTPSSCKALWCCQNQNPAGVGKNLYAHREDVRVFLVLWYIILKVATHCAILQTPHQLLILTAWIGSCVFCFVSVMRKTGLSGS